MPILDVVLIIILAGFIFYGFSVGLIRAVGALLGIIAGAWLAASYYLTVFSWFSQWWIWQEHIGKILSFILCFTLASMLVGWIFAIIEGAFNVAAVLPFLKSFNRLLGAAFGFLEGAIVCGLILFVIGRYVPESTAFGQWIETSAIVGFLVGFSKIIAPMLPELFKKVKGFI